MTPQSGLQADSLDLGTQVVSTSKAHVTLPTRHSRLDGHPVSGLERLDIGANFDDLTTGLVSEDYVVGDAAIANSAALPISSKSLRGAGYRSSIELTRSGSL